jgi:transcriptional regulator with XRE-family HTH domain
MLTSTGRFLRKLRIDKGEILKDMAEKLGVSVSFLSAVENGKKHMPTSWINQICELYHLSENQQKEFTTAIAETEDTIEMNFVGQNLQNRKLAVSFARKFSDIDNKQIEAIKKILSGGKH